MLCFIDYVLVGIAREHIIDLIITAGKEGLVERKIAHSLQKYNSNSNFSSGCAEISFHTDLQGTIAAEMEL